MLMASTYNLWSVAGSVYALAGAALFLNATFLTPVPSKSGVSQGSSDDVHALRRLGAQWLDSRVGAALLAAGFFLQMTGAVGTAALNTPAAFVLLGLALFAAYYALSRDLIVDGLLFSTPGARQDEALYATPEAIALSAPPAEVSDVVVEFRQSETAV